MELNAVNPRPFLDDVTGRWISVKLKWGWELRGILKSSDAYMNLHLLNAEEWVQGDNRGTLGEILIRCNNVMYIRQMPDDS